jgi:hypothetical protein
VLLGAAAAPFLIALGTIIVALAGVIAFFILFSNVAMAALTFVAANIIGLGAAFLVTRKEGQSFTDWFHTGLGRIKDRLTWVRTKGLEPLTNYFELEALPRFQRAGERIQRAFQLIGDKARVIFADIKQGIEFLVPVFQVAFREIMRVGELAFEAITTAAVLATVSFEAVIRVLDRIATHVQTVFRVVATVVIRAIQGTAKLIVAAADAVGATISSTLREFAAKEAFTFGAEEKAVTRAPLGISFLPRTGPGRAVPAGPSPAAAAAAGAAAARRAGAGARAARPDDPCVDVELTDKRKVQVDTKLQLDGQELARSFARTQVELQDRRGFRATPWQRRITLEHGATPVTRST